jgi:hypothetical protein
MGYVKEPNDASRGLMPAGRACVLRWPAATGCAAGPWLILGSQWSLRHVRVLPAQHRVEASVHPQRRVDVLRWLLDYDIGASSNLFQIDGPAVVGVGDKGGRYAALDRDSGQTVWRRRLCPGSHLGGIMTTAAVARGSIWVICNRFAPAALGLPDSQTHTTEQTSIALTPPPVY